MTLPKGMSDNEYNTKPEMIKSEVTTISTIFKLGFGSFTIVFTPIFIVYDEQ
jgi:hypothetical protein